MGCNTNNLYIISFVVGSDSGLAFLSAPTEDAAIQTLRNSGKWNGEPDSYKILQCRNIGMATTIRNELLMESYVNALAAYDAILSATTPYVGPMGPQGKSAYQIATEYGYTKSEAEWVAELKS